MSEDRDAFDVEVHVDGFPPLTDVLYGSGRTADLRAYLADRGRHRALIVAGPTTAATPGLMDPLREALGDALVGVFAGATTTRSVENVYGAIDEVHRLGVDVLVGVGGGTSLVTTRVASVLHSHGITLEQLKEQSRHEPPDRLLAADGALPVVMIPTTMSGAEISTTGGAIVLGADESPSGRPVRLSTTLSPTTVVFDPHLYEATPDDVLLPSVMNGLDKGFDTAYSAGNSAMSDALALHGARLMVRGLRRLGDDRREGLRLTVAGLALVQMRKISSIIHAFGHGVSRNTRVYQGDTHAVMAPHVLRHVFEHHDGRRRDIATIFDLDPRPLSDDEVAERVIEEVAGVRDLIGRPSRWSEVDEARDMDFAAIARDTVHDRGMTRSPVPLTDETAEKILRAAI